MNVFLPFAVAILWGVSAQSALAYGNSGSGTGCHKPTFSSFQPAVNKYTQAFREFSFVTSSNVAPTSIEVSISAGSGKYHFTAKDLEITQQKNGQYEVKGKTDRVLEHGFVRIDVNAHTVGHASCHGSGGVLVRIY